MRLLYNLLLTVLMLGGLPIIVVYLVLSPKRRRVARHRLALSGPVRRVKTPSLWIHALSVGETMAALPLVAELTKRYPHIPIAFSVSTRTGFEIGRPLYDDKVDTFFYAPYDLPWSVNAAIRRIRPRLVMVVETDIWPNLVYGLAQRGIPIVFVNAKLSDRSYAGYRRFHFFFKPLFNLFSHIIVQTDQDRRRFEALGVEPARIVVGGNIKFDQPSIASDSLDRQRLHRQLGIDDTRRVIIAGSTHPGEEALIGASFSKLKRWFPDLFLVVAPRDPLRAGAVADLLSKDAMAFECLSAIENGHARRALDGAVIDRLGLLRQLYAVGDIALVGGSLLKIDGIGGHNPLEPAVHAKPILFGPHANNFREIYQRLVSAGAACEVGSAAELTEAVQRLFNDPQRLQRMGHHAHAFYRNNQGAVAATLDHVALYLENRHAVKR